MARHKGADIGHDDKSVGFMQNAGIDIRIDKVGQPATLEFSTKWAIYHWNDFRLLPRFEKWRSIASFKRPAMCSCPTTFWCSDCETLIFTREPLKNVPQWLDAP